MEAIITPITPHDDPKPCAIEGCEHPAKLHVVKMKDDGTEKEEFFCEEHGQEYSRRGHLVISENS